MPDTLHMTGGLVDVALRQTHEAGLTYACVPLPWLGMWADFASDGASFEWFKCCGLSPDSYGWDLSTAEQDGDGNVWLCLLECDHVGTCGHSHVR